jgi:hypothetical protein
MTKITFTFPVRRTAPLYCVWFETGNPAQPLACKWMASEEAEASSRPASAAASRRGRFCA